MHRDAPRAARDPRDWIGAFGLVVSAVALGVAPLALEDSYSWIEHTTSESGGQGVRGAWVARTGFVSCGLAVLWITARRRAAWHPAGTVLHLVFAICMIAVAVFSSESWIRDAAADATENTRHSAAATIMGFAFAFGVMAVAVSRRPLRWRWIDVLALLASVALPIAMARFGSIDGVLQRAMFGIAYCWYGIESLKEAGSK
jgi:hypothetical protein